MAGTWQHTTVLLNEAVDALVTKPEAIYVDATFGRGGHARRILQQLEPQGRLVAFDKDPEAVAVANAIGDPRFEIRHQGFAAIGELPAASVAGLLMTSGSAPRRSTTPSGVFPFAPTGRSTCAWIPRAGRAPRSFSPPPRWNRWRR